MSSSMTRTAGLSSRCLSCASVIRSPLLRRSDILPSCQHAKCRVAHDLAGQWPESIAALESALTLARGRRTNLMLEPILLTSLAESYLVPATRSSPRRGRSRHWSGRLALVSISDLIRGEGGRLSRSQPTICSMISHKPRFRPITSTRSSWHRHDAGTSATFSSSWSSSGRSARSSTTPPMV